MTTSTRAGILGAADGVTSIAGVIAAGASQHAGHSRIALIAIGGALSATVSMAGAELLSEDRTDWTAVEAMAAGTLAGSALPAIPLLALTGAVGWVAVTVVAVTIACAVGEIRHRMTRRDRTQAYVLTLAVLAAGALVGYAAGAA